MLADIDARPAYETLAFRIKPNLLRAAEVLIEQDLLFLMHADPEPISVNQALNLLIESGLAHLYNRAEEHKESEADDEERYRLMVQHLDSHPDEEFVSVHSFPDNLGMREYLEEELAGHKTGLVPRAEVKQRYAEIQKIVPQLTRGLASLDPLFNSEPVPV